MKDFSLISNENLKGIHIKQIPSNNEKSRNEDFSLFEIEFKLYKGIHIEEILPKMRNPGIANFSLISN